MPSGVTAHVSQTDEQFFARGEMFLHATETVHAFVPLKTYETGR
jgi:hypothetical protein